MDAARGDVPVPGDGARFAAGSPVTGAWPGAGGPVMDPDDPRLDEAIAEAFDTLHKVRRRPRPAALYARRRYWRVGAIVLAASIIAFTVGVVIGVILSVVIG